jgi:AraC-like DNA-binding protein
VLEQRWVIDPERERDAAERLEDVMARVMLPYAVQPKRFDRRGRAPSVVRRVHFGGLSILECDAPDLFSGVSRVKPRDATDRVLITLVTAGEQVVEQAGQMALLRPGDLFVVDGAQPGTCHIPERVQACVLVVPRAVVAIGDVLPDKISGTSPVGRLLGDHLRALARDVAALPEATARIAARATAELVQVVAAADEPDLDSQALRVALLPQVRRYIERHLGDPDLSPSSVAAANAISLRTLHAMFSATGESVGACIRRRRLESSRDELLARPDLPVIDVARRWGFKSPSHFSRSFKQMYAVAPQDLRAQAPLTRRPSSVVQ